MTDDEINHELAELAERINLLAQTIIAISERLSNLEEIYE